MQGHYPLRIKRLKHTVKRVVQVLMVVVLIAIGIRIFIGEPCHIASASMEPAILAGDWLWINKFSYGSRMPERWADIPLVNAFTHIAALRNADAQINWGYHRLPGIRQPKVGDIIVFNSPENEALLLIKRVAAIQTKNDTLLYCVHGDNAPISRDSRYFGCVPERLVVGTVNRVIISIEKQESKRSTLRTARIYRQLK